MAQSSKDVAEAVEADVDGFEDIKSAMNITAFLVDPCWKKDFWMDFPCLPNRWYVAIVLLYGHGIHSKVV